MLKSIKVRLYPNKDQKDYIDNLLGSCRFVYNKCLAFKIGTYQNFKKSTSIKDTSKLLTELKKTEEFSWLNKSHSKVLQQSLVNLEQSYKNFFKNGRGFPKFKSRKHSKQTCRFPVDAFSGVEGNRINIIRPLSDIHYKCSRRDEILLNKFQKEVRSATLEKDKVGNYFLSILINLENKPVPSVYGCVGLDLGIKDFIIESNGKTHENLKLIRSNQDKISRLQRLHSRKKNGSNNKNKARIKLAKFYLKLTNKKEYYLHSVVNSILKDNQLIAIEDLAVQNMVKNHKLARSIQELSLFRFKSILKYKSEWQGKQIIEIDRFFPSSKLCSDCGFKNTNLTLKDRSWVCLDCGVIHDRDLNAAKNILNEGLRIHKIGLSSPESTLVEIETFDGRETGNQVQSWKQEKNVKSYFSRFYGTI